MSNVKTICCPDDHNSFVFIVDKCGILFVYYDNAYNGNRGCNAPQEVEMVPECTGPVRG